MPAASRILQCCNPRAACITLGVLTASLCLLILSHLWSSYLEGTATYLPEVKGAPPSAPKTGPDYPPVLAYYISGGHSDHSRMIRLLKAVYHPRNRYLLHLDAGAGAQEKALLANLVAWDRTFARFGNVHVIGKADPVDQRGASAVAAILHGAALLLKISLEWDWLVTLDASDYPLVIQDGSPRTILSRNLVEHCIFSLADNFPRKLLMYLSNSVDPVELFFQTVVGNTAQILNRTINHNLRFAKRPGTNHLELLEAMVNSGAAFAGRFQVHDEGLLEKVDKRILNRPHYSVTPGEWCASKDVGQESAAVARKCTPEVSSNIDVIKVTNPAGRSLSSLVHRLIGL